MHLQTETTAWVGEVTSDDVQYNPAGTSVVKTGAIEGFSAFVAPDKPTNANIGIKYPVALRPEFANAPLVNRDAGGRGTAYMLRYGRWLVVAINAHPTKSTPYRCLSTSLLQPMCRGQG